MSNHTPGPWVVTDSNASYRHPFTVAHVPAKPAFVMPIADVIDQKGCKANAFLLAEAPNLLAALKDILRIAKAASHGHTFNAQRIERAEAAITKAEGRE